MSDVLSALLAGTPGASEVYARRVESRSRRARGGLVQEVERLEEGIALRFPGAGGEGGRIVAETAATGLVAAGAPADPELPDRLAPELDLRILCSWTASAVVRGGEVVGPWQRPLAAATLSLPARSGLLARSRIARRLEASDLGEDAAGLLHARALAAAARPRSAPPSIWLPAALAARVLATLWLAEAGRDRPLPGSPVVELGDDPRPEGGPLGQPADDGGAAHRPVVLAGPGAEPRRALGRLRSSFADPALPEARNLALRPRPGGRASEPPAAAFRAAEIEEVAVLPGGARRFALIGSDGSGEAARVPLELDLPGLLARIAGACGPLRWTMAVGAVGAPALLLAAASGEARNGLSAPEEPC